MKKYYVAAYNEDSESTENVKSDILVFNSKYLPQ